MTKNPEISGVDSKPIDPAKDPAIMTAYRKLKFIPNKGPQTEAYFSKADILYFGGAAGGGKSALIAGLALQEHERTLVIRKQFTDLAGLSDEMVKLNGTRDGFTQQPRPKLITKDKRLIEFGAINNDGDEDSYQGRPKDFLAFDEVVQLKESQVRFVMGWLRSTKKGQRCRVIFASNPPVTADGDWVIGMFAPWLDPKHPNPAKFGELRWYITDKDGKDREVDGPEPVEEDGRLYKPLSRTFIPSSLKDNPYLSDTNYAATLDAMPEPYRSAMRDGNFLLSRKDGLRQMIPTDWVKAAQARWAARNGIPPVGIPMCSMGVDCAGGGKDTTVIAPRYDYFFGEFIQITGRDYEDGREIAAQVLVKRKDNAEVVIDMGGGYGGVPYTTLCDIVDKHRVKAYKGVLSTNARSADKLLGFTNTRSAAYWKLREALDPSQLGGSNIMLPDDRELLAELTAVNWELVSGGVKAETKDKVMAKLGRSPDKADAVVMAWWSGARGLEPNMVWGGGKKYSAPPQVVLGYANRRRKR